MKKAFYLGKTFIGSIALVVLMAQCSEDEIVTSESMGKDQSTYMVATTAEVASISVSGLYTEIVEEVACASCTYIVGERETIIDGNALGFKPGSIICLKKSLKYPALEFANMEGSEAAAITIGYCAE